MIKESINTSIKRILGDRPFLVLLSTVIFFGLIYVLVVGFSTHPRDVQVYTRYTAFGEAHFYKNPWQYTLLFAFFGALVTTAHAALMVKLHSLERRQTAIIVGWLSIVILAVALIYALSIMRLAFR